MNETQSSEPIFKGTSEAIESVDLEAPLADARKRVCEYFETAYGQAAKLSEENGDSHTGQVYRFLAVLSSFFVDFGDQSQQFKPMWVINGRRSLLPSDFHEKDFSTTRLLAGKVQEPALRARLYDVLWHEQHNYLDCREAADAYIAAAQNLDTDDDWTYAIKHYRRGLILSAQLGRHKEAFANGKDKLVQAIERDKESESGFRTCQLMEIANEFRIGDSEVLVSIARAMGDRALAQNDYRRARSYWKAEATFSARSGDEESAQEAQLRAAETYVSEAEARITGDDPSYLAATSFLKSGIDALRKAKANSEQVRELKQRLADYQNRSLSEMQSFETTSDISELVRAAREHVKTSNLLPSLCRFATGHPLTDVPKLKEDVLASVNRMPELHLFGGTVLDDEGRARAHRMSMQNLEGEEAEKALEQEMFAQYSQFHLGLRKAGYIDPARAQIVSDHHPSIHDLAFIVDANPFVPPGHAGIFLRGIHAGLHGDFLIAAHLLVPQIENSMRYVLSGHGVDISNLMADGTQPVKILGPLFGLAETKEILGESTCFELRGLLIEKLGCEFRNRLAHGFVSEGECYGNASVNIWWLVFRLCMTPIIHQVQGNRHIDSGGDLE